MTRLFQPLEVYFLSSNTKILLLYDGWLDVYDLPAFDTGPPERTPDPKNRVTPWRIPLVGYFAPRMQMSLPSQPSPKQLTFAVSDGQDMGLYSAWENRAPTVVGVPVKGGRHASHLGYRRGIQLESSTLGQPLKIHCLTYHSTPFADPALLFQKFDAASSHRPVKDWLYLDQLSKLDAVVTYPTWVEEFDEHSGRILIRNGSSVLVYDFA